MWKISNFFLRYHFHFHHLFVVHTNAISRQYSIFSLLNQMPQRFNSIRWQWGKRQIKNAFFAIVQKKRISLQFHIHTARNINLKAQINFGISSLRQENVEMEMFSKNNLRLNAFNIWHFVNILEPFSGDCLSLCVFVKQMR